MNKFGTLHGGYRDGMLFLMPWMCRYSECTACGCVHCPSEHRLPVSAASPDGKTFSIISPE